MTLIRYIVNCYGVNYVVMVVHGMFNRNGEILEEQNKELDLLLQQLMAVEDVGNMHDASDHK